MGEIATSVEQSKELATILPIESADMHYVRRTRTWDGNEFDGQFGEPKYGNTLSKYAQYEVLSFRKYETIPAWSLKALMKLLPTTIKHGTRRYNFIMTTSLVDKDKYYDIGYKSFMWYVFANSSDLIDACVDLIKKLKNRGKI